MRYNMEMLTRAIRGVATSTLVVLSLVGASCGGSATPAATQPSTTPPSTTRPSTTVAPTDVPPSTSVVTVTEPAEPELADVVTLPNLTIRIDPLALDLPQTDAIVNLMADIITAHPLMSAADAVLFASSDESLRWAVDATREVDCLHSEDLDYFRNIGGWGERCGFVQRIDATALECPTDSSSCWNVLNIAAHEFFHVIAAQRLDPCTCEPLLWGNKIANWYNEGIADYVGHVAVSRDGRQTFERAIAYNVAMALQPQVSVDLEELDRLWSQSFGEPWFALLYNRSFMAVALLVERFGAEVVLDTFFDNVVAAGTFAEGFETTFGRSVDEFSAEFDQWLMTL